MTSRMTIRDVIAEKLTKAFAPERLEVIDDSHRHAGPRRRAAGRETHYSVHIVSRPSTVRAGSTASHGQATLTSELQGGVTRSRSGPPRPARPTRRRLAGRGGRLARQGSDPQHVMRLRTRRSTRENGSRET